MTSTVAAVVIARNEAENMQDCIDTLHWADEVVVVEYGSTDDTVAVARTAGATVIQNPFLNFAQQRNDALAAVQSDWVLFVDADERVTTALSSEIRRVLRSNPAHSGYWIPRHNYIFGRLTRHTGWYPDYQMRLLKRGAAHYDPDRKVHELVILEDGSEAGYLENPLVHYNYNNIRHFIEKQRSYAKYDANIMFEHGVCPKLRNFILQPLRQFYWRLFILDGYKDGLHGLLLSVLMAWNEFDKYRQLRKLCRGKLEKPRE